MKTPGKSTFHATEDLHFIPRISTERQPWQWHAVIPVLYQEMEVEKGDSPGSCGPASPEISTVAETVKRSCLKTRWKGEAGCWKLPSTLPHVPVTLVPACACAPVYTHKQLIKKKTKVKIKMNNLCNVQKFLKFYNSTTTKCEKKIFIMHKWDILLGI